MNLALTSPAAREQEPLRVESDPRVSQSNSQLALTSLTLGCHFDVAASGLAFVAAQRRDDGGWGDADDPPDLLTTLVALDLLSHFDPEFDPAPTVSFLERNQQPDGFWRAFGPEAPWLTAMVVEQLNNLRRPFAKALPLSSGAAGQLGPQNRPAFVRLLHGAFTTVLRNARFGARRGRARLHRLDRL